MKTIKRSFLFFLAACLLLSLAACGAAKKAGVAVKAGADRGIAIGEKAAYVEDGAACEMAATDGMAAPGEGQTEAQLPRPGQIPAGAQNDNPFYAQWLDLFRSAQEPETRTGGNNDPDSPVTTVAGGRFEPFLANAWGLHSQYRVAVKVVCGEAPVAGARVVAAGGDGSSFAAVTDANGQAYLFPTAQSGTVRVASGTHTAEATYDPEHRDLTVTLDGAEEKANVIQIMFVVDVTGSMGDEIAYLQGEITDVITRVAAANAGARVDLAFLFYRDVDDDVPFRYADFKDVTRTENLSAQRAILAEQKAYGGGDYEEAVDEALALAVGKQWSQNATKLLFLVLDAPAHSGQEYETRFAKAVRSAAEQGIRVCPVLASGADTVCEYTTRSAALLTGGTFVFITNHSGIGGDHLDPDLPDVTVEYLNDCLVRLVNGYHSGVFAEPVAWNAQAQ